EWRALLGSWEIPLETCPELGTPAIPGRPSQLRSYPDAAFRWWDGVGIATTIDFGAEPSRPASLLCTLHTHQSPGEWQHSLPACSLALTGRDLHPLDFIKWFPLLHYWFLLPRFSQRDLPKTRFSLSPLNLNDGNYSIACCGPQKLRRPPIHPCNAMLRSLPVSR